MRQAIAKLPGGGYAANTASGTAIQDLACIARAHNVEVFAGDGASSVGWGLERIRRHLEQGHPVTVLTRLARLPGYSPTTQIDHYILLIGATAAGYIYHDAGQSNGARRTISDRQLQLAMQSSGVPGQGIALTGPRGAKPAAAAASPTLDVPTVKYRVARGDTVSQLAQRHGISQQQLLALNGGVVRNVNHIEVGQSLTLPVPPKPTAAAPAEPAKPAWTAAASAEPAKPAWTAAASAESAKPAWTAAASAEPAKPSPTAAPTQAPKPSPTAVPTQAPPKPTPAATRATEQQRRAD